ncbi:MAG: gamma-glutamylcyclotransferase family protein [Pseudomonadota bacterium]
MNIFFYGLFMDDAILAQRGISPRSAETGYVAGFALQIGARAALVRTEGARAYGVMMNIDPSDAAALYSEPSVADYRAEPVIVTTDTGGEVEATCYNLPAPQVSDANQDYAKSLERVAKRLGFPEPYLEAIRRTYA